ncbi:MAG: MmgE/PrpD family protein, partial [Nocardioidaceae bacterium]
MKGEPSFRLEKRTESAVNALASQACGMRYGTLPDPVRDRLQLVLTDLFGVTVAGMRTPELHSLLGSWVCPPGEVALPGTMMRTVPETASYLSAVAACCLELDEGNKYAAGHPAAHVVFAAIAAAQMSATPPTGPEFLTAVAAGYEVAARFGAALRRKASWHTHGHWGATGAACAAALVLGASAAQVAAAIDSATGLMHVTPWATVISGDFTRNLWMAGANIAGLTAARLAIAGLTRNTGGAQHSLGTIVGALDPDVLVEDLGSRWLTTQGYIKRHASCSYTHSAVDLVQSIRAQRDWRADDVAHVRVATHSLSRALLGRDTSSRLAAMFSLPFVVSTAVVNGSVDP